MTRIIYIRHGESNVTVDRVIGGHRTCSGLSELGRQQAARLHDRLLETAEINADVLISSHFPRAIETARILAPALGFIEPEIVAGFGEHDPGEQCDGMAYEEFASFYGGLDWEDNPYVAGFPGGESVAAFHLRVGIAIAETIEKHEGQTVVVVCHGGVIDAALRQALKVNAVGMFDIHTLNTSITELLNERPPRWKLVRYNDFAHLHGLPRESPRRER